LILQKAWAQTRPVIFRRPSVEAVMARQHYHASFFCGLGQPFTITKPPTRPRHGPIARTADHALDAALAERDKACGKEHGGMPVASSGGHQVGSGPEGSCRPRDRSGDGGCDQRDLFWGALGGGRRTIVRPLWEAPVVEPQVIRTFVPLNHAPQRRHRTARQSLHCANHRNSMFFIDFSDVIDLLAYFGSAQYR
jgi:hypothetical protein